MPICGRLDPKYDYILVTLLSNHSGIIWQREDNVLEWIASSHRVKRIKYPYRKYFWIDSERQNETIIRKRTIRNCTTFY